MIIRIKNKLVFYSTKHIIMHKLLDATPCDGGFTLTMHEFNMENLGILSQGKMRIQTAQQYLSEQNNVVKGWYFLDNQNNAVGYIWLYNRGANELEYRIRGVDNYLSNLYVFPQYRRRGYATQILQQVMSTFSSGDKLYLACRIDNQHALNLYLKLGFCKDYISKYYRILGHSIPYKRI